MSTVYGFSNEDDFERTADVVRLVLRKMGIREGDAAYSNLDQQLYVRCDTVIESEDTEINKKAGTATQVEFDFTTHDWVTRGSDPMIFDYDLTAAGGNTTATFFNTSNIFSESELVAGNIYLVAPYYGSTSHQFGDFVGSSEEPTKSSWIVIETGGASEGRSRVIITEVISASEYKGKIITQLGKDPANDAEIIDIVVVDAVTNEFDVGYKDFADKITTEDPEDSEKTIDVYVLDGWLLG